MNLQIARGHLMQVAGLTRETWGRWVGDETCRRTGFQQRIAGRMCIATGHAQLLLQRATPRVLRPN